VGFRAAIVLAFIGGLLEWLHSLPGHLALAAIFLFPALEASAFLGVLVPGEAAILVGGALAASGRIPLALALAAAILGAIVGDTVGYSVGKRWGKKMMPRLSRRRARRLDQAQRLLRDRPGWAIVLGRFPPGVRTFVPGAAGMARVSYPRFLFYNVLGGVLWGTTFVLLGYAAGRSWRHVEALVTRGGLVLLAAFVLAAWLAYGQRRRLAALRSSLRRALAAIRLRPRRASRSQT
jgi:undecaprenyl-diphosphatase